MLRAGYQNEESKRRGDTMNKQAKIENEGGGSQKVMGPTNNNFESTGCLKKRRGGQGKVGGMKKNLSPLCMWRIIKHI